MGNPPLLAIVVEMSQFLFSCLYQQYLLVNERVIMKYETSQFQIQLPSLIC